MILLLYEHEKLWSIWNMFDMFSTVWKQLWLMSYDDRVTLTFLLYNVLTVILEFVWFYREDFRKQFKKDNPDNKAVSAVSIHCCFVGLYIACNKQHLLSCIWIL